MVPEYGQDRVVPGLTGLGKAPISDNSVEIGRQSRTMGHTDVPHRLPRLLQNCHGLAASLPAGSHG